jgi:hypothetical protein
VQFVLFIYQGTAPLPNTPAWEQLSEAEQQQVYADYAALGRIEGLTGGLPLGLPSQATTVRVEGGSPIAQEGSYLDPSQAVGGYFTLEADDLEAAQAVAAKVPAARLGGAIEIRPMAVYW